MDSSHVYEVDLNWQNSRKGSISAPSLHTSIEVATPPEFPGGIPGIWSPEHLLVAAVNSCLMTTFLAIAENSKLPFLHFESKARGKLEKVDGQYMISEIVLLPVLTIASAADNEKAEKVLRKSEAACLISHSVKAAISLHGEIKIAGSALQHHVLINHSIATS